MGHERFDQQDGAHVNGVARPDSAVVGAGMVLPEGSTSERTYGDHERPDDWATRPLHDDDGHNPGDEAAKADPWPGE